MTILIQDLFNGGTDNDIHGRTPDTTNTPGGTWIGTPTSGGLKVGIGGAVYVTAVSDAAIILFGASDQDVAVTFNAGGADNRFSVRIRWTSGGSPDGYTLNFRTGDTGNELQVYKTLAGIGTQIGAKIAFTVNTTTDYIVRISIQGSAIKTYIDGVLKHDFIDTAVSTGTYCGFEHNLLTNANARFRDFTASDFAAGGVTGTLAITLDDITAAMTGVVEVTGTLATTLGDIAVNASGTFTPSGFTGTMAVTLDSITVAASGTVTNPGVTGTLAATLGDAQVAMAGVVEVTGALATTLDNIVVAFSGAVRENVTGTFDITLGGVTLSVVGSSVSPSGWSIEAVKESTWSKDSGVIAIWTKETEL